MNPKNVPIEIKLNAIAKALDEFLREAYGERMGFVLVAAPEPKDGPVSVQCISNLHAEPASLALRTILNQWDDKQPPQAVHATH